MPIKVTSTAYSHGLSSAETSSGVAARSKLAPQYSGVWAIELVVPQFPPDRPIALSPADPARPHTRATAFAGIPRGSDT